PGPVGSAKPFGAISPIPFPFNFLRTLLHAVKINSLLFNRFRTLCQKTPGVGGTPFCYYPASHPRRRHELYPKARRNPRWLRASLLGRQHHGDLRAPLLLWRVRFPRQLSARKAGFSHRADRHARRNLWRHGLVSRDFRRSDRRPPRIPPRALAGLL